MTTSQWFLLLFAVALVTDRIQHEMRANLGLVLYAGDSFLSGKHFSNGVWMFFSPHNPFLSVQPPTSVWYNPQMFWLNFIPHLIFRVRSERGWIFFISSRHRLWGSITSVEHHLCGELPMQKKKKIVVMLPLVRINVTLLSAGEDESTHISLRNRHNGVKSVMLSL